MREAIPVSSGAVPDLPPASGERPSPFHLARLLLDAGAPPALAYGLVGGVKITGTHTAPAAGEFTSPLALVSDAGEHFYGSFLASGDGRSPDDPLRLEWEDPLWLTLKATSFMMVRTVLRTQAVTHDRKNRAGTCTAAAAALLPWSPFTRACILGAGLRGEDELAALPDPTMEWTSLHPDQKTALEAWISCGNAAYGRWNTEVFQAAMLGHPDTPGSQQGRNARIRMAWGAYWDARLSKYWHADDIDPAAFPKVAKAASKVHLRRRMMRAWKAAVVRNGGSKSDAAIDLADRWVRRSGSVFVDDDGEFRFNYAACLLEEARRLERERELSAPVVTESALTTALTTAKEAEERISIFESAAAAEATVLDVDAREVLDRLRNLLTDQERRLLDLSKYSRQHQAAILAVSAARVSQLWKSIDRKAQEMGRGGES